MDYEILFLETEPNEVARLVELLASELRAAGMEARHGVAWYPRDGRSTDALLARGNALLRPPATDGKNGAAAEPPRASGAGMERLRALAKRAAASNISVLILGETGVGKDVLAREIHRLSPRSGPFVALNCAGLAETLIETELFGHERGAFTGAARAKVGLLEAGNGGTIFLDEIGEMPMSLQPQAAARHRGARGVAGRRGQAAAHRRAVPRRDQPRPRGRGRARARFAAISTSA